MSREINIAIDGYSSTGKSTLAKQLATKLGYRYVDTGAMYRAVTLWALRNGWLEGGTIDSKMEKHLHEIELDFERREDGVELVMNGENVSPLLSDMQVANHVSRVASISAVRRLLVKLQQKMARDKAVVMDGRDIGTVVIPDAELKIFMTASNDIRAKRRYEELKAKGREVSMAEVAANIESRDYQDTTRADSPLKQADDAVELDNSNLSPEEQLDKALKWARQAKGING